MEFSLDNNINNGAATKTTSVGGGGGNTVNHTIEENVKGVELITTNTDIQTLEHSRAEAVIRLGPKHTRGPGAGSQPEAGQKATEGNGQVISESLQSADMIFITAGMDGRTGTDTVPVVAKVAKGLGALTIDVVTRPFSSEGPERGHFATEGIALLKENVDILLIISDSRLLEVIGKKTPMLEVSRETDNILRQDVQGVSDLATALGCVDLSFADVEMMMENQGTVLMRIGVTSGGECVIEAMKKTISSPLSGTSIDDTEQVLLNITGGLDMTLSETRDTPDIIINAASGDVNIIPGTSIDGDLGDKIHVTIAATGTDELKKDRKPHHQTKQAVQLTQRTTQSVEISQLKSREEADAFGGWDIRREQDTHPKVDESSLERVDKKGFDTFHRRGLNHNDGELSTPLFFRRGR